MARLTDQEIDEIAQRIAAGMRGVAPPQWGAADPAAKSPAGESPAPHGDIPQGLGVFATVDEAVRADAAAQPQVVRLKLEQRAKIIAAIRRTMLENCEALAKAAHDETGYGRYEDKVMKNRLVTEKTPGLEDLAPIATSGDHGLTIVEPAPFGVIGAITPVTNPTSTIICNSIGMLAAGNTVVFNVHPYAKSCCMQTIALINKAIVSEGGPANVVTGVSNPTIESANELMRHPSVRLVVVTGGPDVVKAAMGSGKRAICAGPGNPPVVVDESADIDKAARDIIMGASTDNNIICTDEKETIAVASIADSLMAAFSKNSAVVIGTENVLAREKASIKKKQKNKKKKKKKEREEEGGGGRRRKKRKSFAPTTARGCSWRKWGCR